MATDKRLNEVIRVVKRPSSFVTIDKTFLEDSRLSFKAKGILAYLLSKPDNWKVIVANLVNYSSDGKASVYAGLKELKEYGYYKKIAVRDKVGVISHWESTVYEVANVPLTNFREVDNREEVVNRQLKPLTDFQEVDNREEVINRQFEPLTDFQEMDNREEVINRDFEPLTDFQEVDNQEEVISRQFEPLTDFQEMDNREEVINRDFEPLTDFQEVDNREEVINRDFEPLTDFQDVDNQDIDNRQHSNNYNNKINNNYNNQVLSCQSKDLKDETDMSNIFIRIYKNISYDDFTICRPQDIELIDEIISIMVDAMVTRSRFIRVGRTDKPKEIVKQFLMKLKYRHIENVLEQFKDVEDKITKKSAYILTMLYNEAMEHNAHFTNWVKSNEGKCVKSS